jgi:enoyl-CoA hydratase/carnithine racemase
MPITTEKHERVGLVTIDRPEQMNSLDRAHNQALADALLSLAAHDDVCCVVITGAGENAFCAGADLHDLAPSAREAALRGEPIDWHFGRLTSLTDYPKPTIAAVNGHALAGGLELALACDLRLASPNARLGLAETRWALVPGAGGTVRLPRCVPLGIALEMAITADPITAEAALHWGLVNRVVDHPDLVPEALALAERISRRGPLAVRSVRASINRGLGLDVDEALGHEAAAFAAIMGTDDAGRGIAGFAERVEPEYSGR